MLQACTGILGKNRMAARTLVFFGAYFVFFNHQLLIHSICCTNWALPHLVILKAGQNNTVYSKTDEVASDLK